MVTCLIVIAAPEVATTGLKGTVCLMVAPPCAALGAKPAAPRGCVFCCACACACALLTTGVRSVTGNALTLTLAPASGRTLEATQAKLVGCTRVSLAPPAAVASTRETGGIFWWAACVGVARVVARERGRGVMEAGRRWVAVPCGRALRMTVAPVRLAPPTGAAITALGEPAVRLAMLGMRRVVGVVCVISLWAEEGGLGVVSTTEALGSSAEAAGLVARLTGRSCWWAALGELRTTCGRLVWLAEARLTGAELDKIEKKAM